MRESKNRVGGYHRFILEVFKGGVSRWSGANNSGNYFAHCIGCGACWNVCPASLKAFAITGVTQQIQTPGMRPTEPREESSPAAKDGVFPF